MKQKLAAFIIFFIFFAGAAEAQNWREPSTVNELIGKWEGGFTMDIEENLVEMIPKSSIDLKITFDCNAKNYMLAMFFDLEKFISDFANIPEVKMFGITKDTLWEIFVSALEDDDSIDEFDVSIKGYDVILTISDLTGELLENRNNTQGDFYINENKNMLKMVFADPITFVGDEEINELILYKK